MLSNVIVLLLWLVQARTRTIARRFRDPRMPRGGCLRDMARLRLNLHRGALGPAHRTLPHRRGGGGGSRRHRRDHLARILVQHLARLLVQLQVPTAVHAANLAIVLNRHHVRMFRLWARARGGAVIRRRVAGGVGRVDAVAVERPGREGGSAVQVVGALFTAAKNGADAVLLAIFGSVHRGG